MVRGGMFALALKLAYVAAQFGVGVLLARALGPAGLGIYAFVMAVTQVLCIVGQWGVPAFLVRRVTIDMRDREFAEVKANLTSGLALVIITGLLAGAAYFAGTSMIEPGLRWATFPVLGLVVTMALGSVLGGALRGFGFIVPSLLAEETVRLWLLLVFLAVLLALGVRMSASTAMAAHALCAGAALAIGVVLLLGRIPSEVRVATGAWRLRQTTRGGFPFLLLLGAQTLSYQTDTIMLGLLSPGAPVGLYRTAFQIAEAVGILLFAISTVIGPHLARAEQDSERLRLLLVNAHRAGVVLVLPALAVVILLGDRLIAWVFGAEFAPATTAMQILIVGKLFYASVGFVGLALSMIGRTWAAAAISVIVILANVVLDLILIPRFGIEGAAIADTTSNFLVAAFGAVYLRRMLGGGVSAFNRISKRPVSDMAVIQNTLEI